MNPGLTTCCCCSCFTGFVGCCTYPASLLRPVFFFVNDFWSGDMQESPAELLPGIIQFHHKNCTQERKCYSGCIFFLFKKKNCLDEDDIARWRRGRQSYHHHPRSLSRASRPPGGPSLIPPTGAPHLLLPIHSPFLLFPCLVFLWSESILQAVRASSLQISLGLHFPHVVASLACSFSAAFCNNFGLRYHFLVASCSEAAAEETAALRFVHSIHVYAAWL